MFYRYSNNGQSFDRVGNGYQAMASEVLFADVATPTQLTAAFNGYAAIVAAGTQQAGVQALKQQLETLDAYLPRGLEDYLAASAFDTTKLPQVQQQRLQEKQQLRASLVSAMKPSGS